MTDRLLTFDRLKPEKGVPYSRQHIYVLVEQGDFPKPIRLSPRRIAWRDSDIEKWIEERAAAQAA